jgi:tyrosine-protein kinase Etk/Wzc
MTENTPTPATVIASEARQSMPSVPEDDEISLLDLLQVVADNLRLLVLGPLVAGLLALGYSFTIPPTFTATTKFMPPQQQQSGAAAMLAGLGALGGLAGAAGIKNPADQYVAFLKSRSVQDVLVERFKLMERYETEFREDARNALGGSVQIVSGKEGLITIDANDKDPAFAAQLANAHVEELGKLLNRLAITEAQQRRVFFEKQLVNAKDNLAKAEQALASSGVNSAVLKSTGAVVAAVAQLKGQIAAQEIKLASMRGYLAESAPDFKQAQTELSAWRAQLGRAEKAEPATVLSGSDSDYISRFRDFKYFETLFELFAKQYEMARIDESREGAVIQVVDAAVPPEFKAKPKKAQIAMMTSLAIGFALLLLIFINQALRGAAQAPESAEKLGRLRQAWSKALGRGPSLRVLRQPQDRP